VKTALNVVIIGVGLIGGSVSLALKASGVANEILGVDRDTNVLSDAQRRGVIDRGFDIAGDEWHARLAHADVILLAIPVRQIPEVLRAVAPHLDPSTIMIDAGSTKQDVIAAARDALGLKLAQFIPCHPIAGREVSGVSAADAGLFQSKNLVITSFAENSPATIERARRFWQACGANVIEMPAATHDAVFAAVSHLPHMLAFALVDDLAARPNAKTLFSFAASGFRDFTRIASSSPEMWRDVALNNRDALLSEMDAYLAHAQRLRDLIATADGDQLAALMQRSRAARAKWLAGDLDGFRDEAV
jgi:prephenate dehydrogenase